MRGSQGFSRVSNGKRSVSNRASGVPLLLLSLLLFGGNTENYRENTTTTGAVAAAPTKSIINPQL